MAQNHPWQVLASLSVAGDAWLWLISLQKIWDFDCFLQHVLIIQKFWNEIRPEHILANNLKFYELNWW